MRDLQVTPAQKRAAAWTTWSLVGGIVLAVAMVVYLALGTGAVVQKDSLLAGLGYTGRMADITQIYLYGDRQSKTRSEVTISGFIPDFVKMSISDGIYYNDLRDSAVNGDISDVSDFSQLANLKELSIAGNKVVDVSPLWKLRNLEFLDLTGNPVRDLTGIGGLTRLNRIDISDTAITDLTPLDECKNLKQVLSIRSNILDSRAGKQSIRSQSS